MKNSARIQKRLILLIAFSIIWIFIGSLVIFHQEQVLGKTFKFNTSGYIVPKSKEDRTFKNLKSVASDRGQHLILAVLDDCSREQILAGFYSLQLINCDEQTVPVFVRQSSGLRAPPLA